MATGTASPLPAPPPFPRRNTRLQLPTHPEDPPIPPRLVGSPLLDKLTSPHNPSASPRPFWIDNNEFGTSSTTSTSNPSSSTNSSTSSNSPSTSPSSSSALSSSSAHDQKQNRSARRAPPPEPRYTSPPPPLPPYAKPTHKQAPPQMMMMPAAADQHRLLPSAQRCAFVTPGVLNVEFIVFHAAAPVKS
ncbi:hypothetical protein BDW22DRAFT_1425197 [Trametopsis cervina]|nr:hypothetical protein BDW22DRAFT_1425197 [Trametopsis cervina]